MRDTKALQTARNAEADPYRRRFPFPKWNRTVTVTDEPRLFARLPEFDGWMKARHASVATDYAAQAAALDSAYEWLVGYAFRTYGSEGPLISGVVRDHFPDAVKDALRLHTHTATEYRARSFAHWKAAGRTLAAWRVLLDSL